MTPLFAKSAPPGRQARTLVEHTHDVAEAAEALFGFVDCPTRLGREWLRFFRLDSTDWPRFHANLLAACLFHDWGKANQGMQDVLAGKSGGQLFRHEHISALLLGYDGVDVWVRQRNDIDWNVVLSAVGSHHLKFGDQSFAPDDGTGSAVKVLFDHDDFRRDLVALTAARLKLAGTPIVPTQRYWGFDADSATFDPADLRNDLRDGRLRKLSRSADTRMLNAVRSALITADAAGSGLPRTGRSIIDWIGDQFPEAPSCDSVAVSGVIDRRIVDLTSRGKWSDWNEFQNECEKLPDRALLLAPCGAGKTLAAWRWILGQVRTRPVNRVLFLYPTRATATEGFKDYVSWAPEADAALMHGTAGYDLDGMFPSQDPRAKKSFASTDPRLFSLQHWSKRIVSATVDQFFGFMAYGYGPMCLLPVIADSVIVVDEVHSFDRSMFSALLGFLKAFDVPVLCMTATLPEPRQKQLTDVGLTLSNSRPPDLKAIADAPRYQVSRVNEIEVEDRIRSAVESGKRVLWVVNQVARAQVKTASLVGLRAPIICYHSRFKLDDRVNRHRDTIEAIKAGEPAAVAVTTQVCEMSLDIDADLLVTEECPITSLIQRMGRCRRGRDELKEKGPGEVLVYKPAEERVYSPEDLAGLDDFVTSLTQKIAACQADLEDGLAKAPQRADAPKLNSFLASGAYAEAGEDSFRDIEAFNVPAVLASEIVAYRTAPKAEQPGFIVPVPKKLKPAPDPRLPHYLAVADDRHYDPLTGYWDDPIR